MEGYVASWSSDHSGVYEVYAKVFDAEGEPQGSEIKLSSLTNQHQYVQDVIALDDGGFITAWKINATEGAGYEVVARRYTAEGEPVGEVFQINDYIGNNQQNVELSLLSDGRVGRCMAVSPGGW